MVVDEHKPDSPVDPGVESDSDGRHGEEIGQGDKEAGRKDTGEHDATGRPTGTSTARDYTGVDPQDPITK
jgi:hypothetical protein